MELSSQNILSKMLNRYIVKWPYFVAALVISVGLAIAYLTVTKPVYEIKGSILIVDKDKINTEKTALNEIELAPSSKTVEIETEVLQSRKLVWAVIDTLGLQRLPANAAITDTAKLIDKYQDMLEVRLLNQKSSILELNLKDADPVKGKQFLDMLITVYNNDNTGAKTMETLDNLKFIESRLAALSGELQSAEGNIETYKSSRSMTDPLAESKLQMESLEKNNAERSQIGVKIQIIEGIERAIATPGNVPATIGIDDDGLKSQIERLAVLQQQRSKLLATTPESNPLFDPINSQIREATTSIKATAANVKASLQAMNREVNRENSRVESSIKDIPGQERGYVSIKRQQAIKEELYNYLLKKREEVGLNYQTLTTDARIVEAPFVVGVVWPKKPIVFVVAIILALFITAAIVYLIEVLNNTTLSSDEIEDALEIPILSELSQIKDGQKLIDTSLGNSLMSQQFRALRTNLYYVHGSRAKGRVTMVSSSRSGEGKSFATSNLAISLAASGRKTVVVDMDLHKPQIGSIFGIPENSKGVSDYLNGSCFLEDIINSSVSGDKLSVITAGSIISGGSELIENERMAELIQMLKEQFDDIILDTPPLHMVSDGYILSQYSDASLYVLRKGLTKKTELDFIKRVFNEQRLPRLNFIFNGTPEVAAYGY